MDEVKVLVIDDEQNYLDLITETLSQKKYKILQALNGKMGCMVAEKFEPDIIITDWEMPEMSGIETINILKQNPSTRDIPVIMCTGIMTSAQNLETALNTGAVDFIRKPVDPLELIARINSALKLSKLIRKIKSQNENLIELNNRISQKNDEIITQNEQLASLIATKDKFFGIIAHDLRNPFNNILGFSELLSSSIKDYKQDEILKFINTIYDSAQSAYKLLGNLLEWAMSQTGRTQFNPEFFLIEEIIQNAIQYTTGNSQAKSINVSASINEKIRVFADRNMLETILINLLINAIKYTPKNGKVKIAASSLEHYVRISVIDNGVGIPPGKIEKLFDLNEKLSTPGTENEHGTGLGLIICKEFIERHNGKIGVESKLGNGSDFWILIPKRSLR